MFHKDLEKFNAEPLSFLVNNSTLSLNNPLKFKKESLKNKYIIKP